MKRSARQLSIDLVCAEMILEKIDFTSAVSICCRKYPRVHSYINNLYDNCRIAASDKFKRDVLKNVKI